MLIASWHRFKGLEAEAVAAGQGRYQGARESIRGEVAGDLFAPCNRGQGNVSPRLRDGLQNDDAYYALAGKPLANHPVLRMDDPSPESLN